MSLAYMLSALKSKNLDAVLQTKIDDKQVSEYLKTIRNSFENCTMNSIKCSNFDQVFLSDILRRGVFKD
jgi:hypothetical protein